jgi:DNA-directed RNA polymerase subunit N (RpoN/RPB10)
VKWLKIGVKETAQIVSSEMIIPVRCIRCGKLIADQWRYYQEQLRKMKGENAEQKLYFDGNTVPETPEKKVLDSLGITRSCCRSHFLTQVDLIDKI